jgi:tetratricopeptide (TPR) repeat protein
MTSATGALERKTEETEPSIRIGPFRFGPGALLRLALIATALVYVRTITYSFVFDDTLQIEMNPWIQSWKFWRTFFTGHVWSFGRAHIQGNYYRPVFMAWLAGNYSLFKLTPGWWHLTTIAAHVLATGLVYLLASRLLRDRWAGGIAALLFGLNPLHIECVAWVSGIPEVLLTIFFVGALLAYQNWRAGKRVVWLAASVVLYALALLSKETALAFVAVLAVYAWTDSEGNSLRARIQQTIARWLPYVVVTIAYLVVRNRVLEGLVNSRLVRPMSWVVLTWPSALWFYLRQMLWPFRLSIFYDFELVRYFSAGAVLVPALLSVAVIAGCWMIGRRARLGALAAMWILAPLAPAMVGIKVFQWHDYVHDRYAYLPSVMFAILLAVAVRSGAEWFVGMRTAQPVGRKRWYGAVAVAITAAIALTFAASTAVQSKQWDSELALFSHAHERAPQNVLPLDYLARTLYGVGRSEEAVQKFQELHQLDSNYWAGNYVLGVAYYQMGRYDDAEIYLQRATEVWRLETTMPDATQYYYLGLVRQRKGAYESAEVALRKAVEIRPDALGYRLALASVLEQRGLKSEAAEQRLLEAKNRKAFEQRQREFGDTN